MVGVYGSMGSEEGEAWGKDEAGPGGAGQILHGLVCQYFGLDHVSSGDQSAAFWVGIA